ncbi:MAG: hypothetical protein J6A96_01205 [Clostridia bacterium]|nr:hypothetical protein [Clostridia bacterium]
MKRAISLILSFVFIIAMLIGCGKSNSNTYTSTGTTNTNTNSSTSTDTDIVSEHTYEDDGDCTTAEYCDTCGELALEAVDHNFSGSLSYNLRNDDFLQGGIRTAFCTNEGCNGVAVLDVKPFIESYGYSITEYEKTATITSSYAFNNSEIVYYLNYLNDTLDKDVDIEYGIIGYIKRMVKTEPIKQNGYSASYVIKAELSNFSGINDFSIPGIGTDFYDEEIIICAYIKIGNDIYYVQGNKIVTDYTELVSVTANRLKNVAN